MEWTHFNRNIRIEAPISEVYRAWVSIDQLKVWFLKEVEIMNRTEGRICRKADHLKWTWYNAEISTEIEVLKANEVNLLKFTFGHGMEVEIELEELEGWTVLRLHQNKIPTEDEAKFNFYAGCKGGWTFWLTNLKCYLEYGNVLHDPNLGRREDLFDFVNT